MCWEPVCQRFVERAVMYSVCPGVLVCMGVGANGYVRVCLNLCACVRTRASVCVCVCTRVFACLCAYCECVCVLVIMYA